jgi:hypothetical protein
VIRIREVSEQRSSRWPRSAAWPSMSRSCRRDRAARLRAENEAAPRRLSRTGAPGPDLWREGWSRSVPQRYASFIAFLRAQALSPKVDGWLDHLERRYIVPKWSDRETCASSCAIASVLLRCVLRLQRDPNLSPGSLSEAPQGRKLSGAGWCLARVKEPCAPAFRQGSSEGAPFLLGVSSMHGASNVCHYVWRARPPWPSAHNATCATLLSTTMTRNNVALASVSVGAASWQ